MDFILLMNFQCITLSNYMKTIYVDNKCWQECGGNGALYTVGSNVN